MARAASLFAVVSMPAMVAISSWLAYSELILGKGLAEQVQLG